MFCQTPTIPITYVFKVLQSSAFTGPQTQTAPSSLPHFTAGRVRLHIKGYFPSYALEQDRRRKH